MRDVARRDVGPFSSFGTPSSKGERNRGFECKPSQMERERILSEQIDIQIMLFKDTLRLRQDILKRSLNWTEENGKCEMLKLMKQACSTNPRGRNFFRKSID